MRCPYVVCDFENEDLNEIVIHFAQAHPNAGFRSKSLLRRQIVQMDAQEMRANPQPKTSEWRACAQCGAPVLIGSYCGVCGG